MGVCILSDGRTVFSEVILVASFHYVTNIEEDVCLAQSPTINRELTHVMASAILRLSYGCGRAPLGLRSNVRPAAFNALFTSENKEPFHV
jgi:hypothetical protein